MRSVNEGERVLLLEANEVQVEAIAHKVSMSGRTLWFGEFCGEIQVIYPGDEMNAARVAPDEVAKGH